MKTNIFPTQQSCWNSFKTDGCHLKSARDVVSTFVCWPTMTVSESRSLDSDWSVTLHTGLWLADADPCHCQVSRGGSLRRHSGRGAPVQPGPVVRVSSPATCRPQEVTSVTSLIIVFSRYTREIFCLTTSWPAPVPGARWKGRGTWPSWRSSSPR